LLLLVVGILYTIFSEWYDGVFVFCVIGLVVLAEVQNEYRAKRALEVLQRSIPKTSLVIRNSKQQEIQNNEIVVGDFLVLNAGRFVSADARIVECFSLEVDESLLTVREKREKKRKKRNCLFVCRYFC
jgi:Ca2+-transporting ATPase